MNSYFPVPHKLKINSFINSKLNLQQQQNTLWNLFEDKTYENE